MECCAVLHSVYEGPARKVFGFVQAEDDSGSFFQQYLVQNGIEGALTG